MAEIGALGERGARQPVAFVFGDSKGAFLRKAQPDADLG